MEFDQDGSSDDFFVGSRAPVEAQVRDGTYRVEFDPGADSASEVVISAVSSASGTGPVELPPLYSTIDPEALDTLFAPTIAGRERRNGAITFEFAGHVITARAGGTVEVEPTRG
jgi:hypothetical protein